MSFMGMCTFRCSRSPEAVFLLRVVHRWHADVKLDNILRVQGEYKLADFGFAKFTRRNQGRGVPMLPIDGFTQTYGMFPLQIGGGQR